MRSPNLFLGRFVLFPLLAAALGSCASTPPPAVEPPPGATEVSPAEASPETSSAESEPVQVTADQQMVCDLVCERPQVLPRPSDGPDYDAKASENVNAVLEALQPDLYACYTKRIRVNPKAYGFITVDLVIGQDGKVRKVETTGGAILGEGTMDCIAERMKSAEFEPPHGGGTMHVHVPFSLKPAEDGDTI
jgi:hypothetical protein